MRVLVIEADPSSAEVISFALSGGGMVAVRAQTGRAGLEIALAGQVAAVVVDQALPDMPGFDVVRILREHGDLPIVMVADCDREETVIRAFAAGADDIVAKPPRLAELVARLQALMRRVSRQAHETEQLLERGPFRLDQSRLEVVVASRRDPVRLTPLEAKLLGLLMVNANQVMSKARLQELIWGYQNDSSGDLLKTHVRHLRVKLEALPSFPQYIQTINGVGYTFTAPKGPEIDVPPDLVLGVASAARQEDLQAI